MGKYIPTIGIETHVQLATRSKLFCGCSNDAREAAPNTLVCPVCMGFPGTLPVLNREAMRLAVRAGLALNGQIAEVTSFDRKNYFYPDLPKGYQITQMDQPIVGAGYVEFPLGDGAVKVGITRAHMEEDAGKLTHPNGVDYSLVDLNRTGTPLMEVVSEPDMHTATEAKAYAQEIHNLMRYAGVSDADLYHGNMRFDVNVSVAPEGQRGTRTETKNLNSFRAVERAVEYEIKRQSELLDKGEKIAQETRGWDEAKGKTFSQRSKADAHDYRYFPEPDLPPVVVTSEAELVAGKDLMTPSLVRQKLSELGLSGASLDVLVNDPATAMGYLDDVANRVYRDKASEELIARTLEQDVTLRQTYATLTPAAKTALADLAAATVAKTISGSVFKQALPDLVAGEDVSKYLAQSQISDQGSLEKIATGVIEANQKIVADYKAGNERALQALVGQVMKASKGQANPAMVSDILKQKLDNHA